MARCPTKPISAAGFRHLKELGANFARLSHYPHHELVARIADEEGNSALGGNSGLLGHRL